MYKTICRVTKSAMLGDAWPAIDLEHRRRPTGYGKTKVVFFSEYPWDVQRMTVSDRSRSASVVLC